VAGLSEVPLEAVENATEAKVQAVDLSKNNFNTFPEVRKKWQLSVYTVGYRLNGKYVAYCMMILTEINEPLL
jgi:hypothetical protein